MDVNGGNILVVGANGQLGQCFRKLNGDNWYFADIDEIDITDIKSIWDYVDKHHIRMIINCAAYTNVDKAEDEKDKAHLINAIGVENLGSVMRDVDGWLIHISTDYVFGGEPKGQPLKEDDICNPESVYGVTKLCGEALLKNIECKYLVFRTSWLYSEYGKNFFLTMLKLTSEKEELKVVVDQIGTPTYAMDLARYIFNIVKNGLYEGNEGIYHFSNEGVCSWFDFTKCINTISGHKCKIKPCLSDEFPSKVKRPSYSVMSKEKAKNTFKMVIPYWMDSVMECWEAWKYLNYKEKI